ncbi:hypothetical protein SAMN05444483_104289 [Salegentibacter echinorum]|uniref:Serine aminopeptidase S33 domain-containing protein n=1 Tax=Salegentibacter echinorum TaxID=1073325 RepID=A0A1M5GS81_SALEC|nr:alpha/beta hydrolase [Salegentibacter echinorum]SHG06565.1 hypothetical protein SAMN05444483_104289 [Salegentibacter echinorum]
MKKLRVLLFCLCFGVIPGISEAQNFTEDTVTINKFIEGNLVVPSSSKNVPLIILIQGSGPTNRNGNSPAGMGNNSDFAKEIAHQLAENGIASFRFDKRSLKMQELGLKSISFDDFITDAKSILNYFKAENKFSRYIVAGHSQGSLIGMVAAKNKADAFISLAGLGESVDHILVKQLSRQVPSARDDLKTAFKEIKENGSTENYPALFGSFFTKDSQDFLASWIKYNPSEEIAKLDIPVLIIDGTRDLQVEEDQAKMLDSAALNSDLVLVKDMNHIFKEIKEEEKDQNAASYNLPEKPLHPEIIWVLTDFIKNLENN